MQLRPGGRGARRRRKSTDDAAGASGPGAGQHTFHFRSHGLDFEVTTVPHPTLFADDANVEVRGEDGRVRFVDINRATFRRGDVNGNPQHSAHVYHHGDGLHVDGVLRVGNETYRIEPAHRYADVASSPDTGHTTVVFRESDMLPEATAGVNHCGTTAHAKLAEAQSEMEAKKKLERPWGGANPFAAGGGEQRYRRDSQAARESVRRFGGGKKEYCSGQCTCSVLLVADHLFYQGPYGKRDEAVASQNMINMLMVADSIFYETEFDGVAGYGLSVRNVVVYTTTEGNNPVGSGSFGGDEGAVNFLNAFGQGDDIKNRLPSACLATMFTHRDFANGVLGLAWVATTGGNAGVCEAGYNTAFITSLNFQATVQLPVSQITLTHEIGHNHGSSHDTGADGCSPGGGGGNYIMYPQATDGSKVNNRLFSTCSRDQVAGVLAAKSAKCYSEAREVCGNGFVEGDEACDCGSPAECEKTACCTDNCTVPENVQCSPQNPITSPCCTDQCTFTPEAQAKECFSGNDCQATAVCDGTASACPVPLPKADGTECGCQGGNCTTQPDTYTRFCEAGSCNVSICEKYNGVECELELLEDACELACVGPTWGNGTCTSTFSDDRDPGFPEGGRFLPSGSTCKDYEGYCDEGSQCVVVDSEALLDRLADYFSGIDANAVWAWISSDWVRSGGILGATVVLVSALYMTRRRNTNFGYVNLDDAEENLLSPEDVARHYGGTEGEDASNIRRQGTVFQNTKSKF